MSDTLHLQPNEVVPVSYNAGLIVLSYLVSLAGCATCLELLHRRTSRLGIYNWYLLITSAICMGGIGIWCMHFIGNRAVTLHDGARHQQVSYSTAFTAISFFLPIVVLTLAFYFIGVTERAGHWYIVLSGILTGAAVCGMHYVGQLGIANYRCTNDIAHVFGASIIAVFASTTALGVFFRLRATWSNNWWKRLATALFLAVAVSGMHWTATVGTTYRMKSHQVNHGGELSSSQTVIVCTTLSCVTCIFLIALALVANRRHKRSENRVRQLVLACAFFDQYGRVMVSSEGNLPTRKITNQYVERSFADDDFSRTHTSFIWAFRASRNWTALMNLVPKMRNHLMANESTKQYYPGNGNTAENDAELGMDFETIFKELFSVAAQDLAEELRQPLDKIGVLYDDILATGTETRPTGQQKAPSEVSNVMGKGQFLFTVRQLKKNEAANLSASGFRFAAPVQVAPILSRNMQVPHDEMLKSLGNMGKYAESENMMSPGVHLICFSLHPSVSNGFDVLVYKNSPNILPNVPLPIDGLTQWHVDILSRMDGWSLPWCLRWLEKGGEYNDPEAKEFCQEIYIATSKLANTVVDLPFGQVKFSARQITIPCKSTSISTSSIITTSKCTAFSFHIINDLQSKTITSSLLQLTPLRLFSAKQQVYPGMADHAKFRQGLLSEFIHCAGYNGSKSNKSTSSTSSLLKTPPPKSPRSPILPLWSGRSGGDGGGELSKLTSHGDDNPLVRSPSSSYGGIVVSNEVTVDFVDNGKPPSFGSGLEMRDLNTTVEAGYNGETFVDELYSLCKNMTDSKLHMPY